MKRLRSFVITTLIGGLAVILPLLLLVALARWLAGMLKGLMKPLTTALGPYVGGGESAAFLVALACLLAACFVTGIVVRTRIGAMLYEHVDGWLAKLTPGYRTVRDTVGQLLGSAAQGSAGALRGDVALVRLMGPDSHVVQTAIVTARHADGSFTVYVPTAPLPTQGFVYHLAPDCVTVLPDVSFEAAMRMVLACGAGAAEVLPERPTSIGAGSAAA